MDPGRPVEPFVWCSMPYPNTYCLTYDYYGLCIYLVINLLHIITGVFFFFVCLFVDRFFSFICLFIYSFIYLFIRLLNLFIY